MSDVKKIKDCKPCGNQVLIEMLTEQEMANTTLFLGNNTKKLSPEYQAIILAIGPMVRYDSYGFSVGDRVVISGMAVPVPEYGEQTDREKKLVEPTAIKAVLV